MNEANILLAQAMEGGRLTPDEAMMVSPLVLAYVGDTVYDLYVRTYLVTHHDLSVRRLNERAIRYVSAAAQAETVEALLEKLSEQELEVFKRGRNAKSAHIPKNAQVQQYRAATGLEALLGYLYLSGNQKRLGEILSLGIAMKEE